MKITLALKIIASKRTLVSMGYYTAEESQIVAAHPTSKNGAKTQLPWLVYPRFLIWLAFDGAQV